jgi:chitinase
MYQHQEDQNTAFNTNYTVHYWLAGGLRRSKLILGMPMYGQSFTLISTANNGLNAKSSGGGTACWGVYKGKRLLGLL